MGTLIGGIVFTNIAPNAVRIFGFFSILTGFVVATVLLVFGRRLKCPACKKRLEPASGLYCPQCGSDRFEYGRHPTCSGCGGTIQEEDSDSARSYWIRGCTHCGTMLDEKGV
jgi:hypothetical protein